MVRRIFVLAILLGIAGGCATSAPVPPAQAQQILRELWQVERHAVWEIDWPAAPIAGPLTVETWQAGLRYRYEILESTVPALIGATLVSDGQRTWQYNRFDPPPTFEPAAPNLAPVSETFAQIERLLSMSATGARQSTAQINFQATRTITLIYPNGASLTVWWDEAVDLPVQVAFTINGQTGEVRARMVEPLAGTPEAIFGVGAWALSRP